MKSTRNGHPIPCPWSSSIQRRHDGEEIACFPRLSKALGYLGFKGVLATGMALLAVGLVLLARAPLPNTYLLDLLPASLLVALGLPAAFAGTNIAAVTAVEQADTGLASGLVNTMQRIGSG